MSLLICVILVKNEKLKIRRIEEPNSILKPIHKQIHNLISQLPAPDYLFSKKKSSCVLNAKVHSLAKGKTLNIDIENFFPSTAKWKVQNFFGYYLQYNRDVANEVFNKLITAVIHNRESYIMPPKRG